MAPIGKCEMGVSVVGKGWLMVSLAKTKGLHHGGEGIFSFDIIQEVALPPKG